MTYEQKQEAIKAIVMAARKRQQPMRWSSNYGGGTPYGYGVICYV